jgi:chromosome segregation ATPase
MPLLDNEKARVGAEIQSAESDVATLLNQIEAERQRQASASSDADAARVRLADREAQRPALEAAVASREAALEAIEAQIAAHQEVEPDRVIEVPNRPPRPNPAWRTWKVSMDQLVVQRDRAATAAAAARAPLDQLNVDIARINDEIRAAVARRDQAAAAAARFEEQRAAAEQRLLAARERLDELERWSGEIARDPLDRTALEASAAALSERAQAFADEYAVARAAARAADTGLAALNGRREQLVAQLTDIAGRLPAAEEAVRTADVAVANLEQQIADQLGG